MSFLFALLSTFSSTLAIAAPPQQKGAVCRTDSSDFSSAYGNLSNALPKSSPVGFLTKKTARSLNKSRDEAAFRSAVSKTLDALAHHEDARKLDKATYVLQGTLLRHASNPALRTLLVDVNSDSELKRIIGDYLRDHDSTVLFMRLKASRGFWLLFLKYRNNPEMRSIASELLQTPAVKELVKT